MNVRSFRGGVNSRMIVVLIVILLVLNAASVVFDMRRVDRILHSLAMREAEGIVYQLEREFELAALGERITGSYAEDHLFAACYLLEDFLEVGRVSARNLSSFAGRAGVSQVGVFDGNFRWRAGMAKAAYPDSSLLAEAVASMRANGLSEWILGFYRTNDNNAFYAVVLDAGNGSWIFAAQEAETLFDWRKRVGVSAILQTVELHPGVEYALLVRDERILGATKTLPFWVGTDEDPFREDWVDEETWSARFANVDGSEHFEAAMLLRDSEGVRLRIGLETSELGSIRHQTLLSMVVRTILFIVLGAILIIGTIIWQNHRLLKAEAERIRREVERLEADRRASERLEAMGKLAGGVAHEIRNPLNTIGMVSQRLELEFEPKEDQNDYVELIGSLRQETSRLGRIVEDFLAFARPPQANRQSVDLAALLREQAVLFRSTCAMNGGEFVEEISVSGTAFIDRDHVAQAVQNLLKNAYEAAPENDQRIWLRAERVGNEIWIEVEDNGAGVPEEERIRIFHLYHTTKANGTGVGLALVHRIADEHFGRVEVLDGVEGGALFRLVLKGEAA